MIWRRSLFLPPASCLLIPQSLRRSKISQKILNSLSSTVGISLACRPAVDVSHVSESFGGVLCTSLSEAARYTTS